MLLGRVYEEEIAKEYEAFLSLVHKHNLQNMAQGEITQPFEEKQTFDHESTQDETKNFTITFCDSEGRTIEVKDIKEVEIKNWRIPDEEIAKEIDKEYEAFLSFVHKHNLQNDENE